MKAITHCARCGKPKQVPKVAGGPTAKARPLSKPSKAKTYVDPAIYETDPYCSTECAKADHGVVFRSPGLLVLALIVLALLTSSAAFATTSGSYRPLERGSRPSIGLRTSFFREARQQMASPFGLHGHAALAAALGAGVQQHAAGGQGVAAGTGRIYWGGRYFSSPAELVAWMNARGQHTSVGQFLGNHPGVAAEYGQRDLRVGGFPNPSVLRAGSGDGGFQIPLPRQSGPPSPFTHPLIGPPVQTGGGGGFPGGGVGHTLPNPGGGTDYTPVPPQFGIGTGGEAPPPLNYQRQRTSLPLWQMLARG